MAGVKKSKTPVISSVSSVRSSWRSYTAEACCSSKKHNCCQ